jgi:hypothetical protein
MNNLDKRLAKIEHELTPTDIVVVWKDADESADSAVARWMADRPGEPDPRNNPRRTVHLVSWEAST